jgi:hypothetical protein
MYSMESGKLILRKEVQLAKALSPMEVTDCGRWISTRLLQPPKAAFPMLSNPYGSIIVLKLSQLANVSMPT